jgi:IMP dehydrogenase
MGKLDEAKECYTFDDFVLVPNFSSIKSRKEPDVAVKVGAYSQNLPIIASPMNTVTETKMIEATSEVGAGSVLHRYMNIDDQVKQCKVLNQTCAGQYFAAVGASGDFLERAGELWKAGVKHLCIDVANGHSQSCVDAADELKRRFSGMIVMAGDVCSYDGFMRLAEVGVELVRWGLVVLWGGGGGGGAGRFV